MTEFLAFLGGFFTALFAEPVRQWLFRSNLRLEFNDAEHFVTQTDEGNHQAKYIRIKVTNSSNWLAKNCRAYLTNIERRGLDGNWEATRYCESLQLSWSGRGDGAYTALDLPMSVPHFIDVLSTRSTTSEFLPSIPIILHSYKELLASTGTFRFTVLVSGNNVKPVSIRLMFEWKGIWNQFQAEKC